MRLVVPSAALLLTASVFAGVAPAQPRADAETQQAFWEFTEHVALALSADGGRVSAIVAPMSLPVTERGRTEVRAKSTVIGPLLSADNAVVVMGTNNTAASVSFDLVGRCIPFSSVRKRYPSILVVHHSYGASEKEWDVFGTQVGDAIISYWFQGTQFGCMRKVNVTPAAATKASLNIK
jgi:hypothetical protein